MQRLLLCVAVVALAVTSGNATAQFTAGNLAVLRVGNGGTLTTAGTAGSIFQFGTATGQVVDSSGTTSAYSTGSSAITAFATGPSGIQFSGTAVSDGSLNRSADGSTLLVGGYSNTAGAASINSSAARTVARTTLSGSASYQVISDGPFTGTNFRSVASVSGGQVWTAGGSTGIVTGAQSAATNADLTTVTVSSSSTDNRNVKIQGATNSLFFDSTTGTATSTKGPGLYAVAPGSVAPTGTGNTPTKIVTLNGSSIAGFALVGTGVKNYQGTGLDTAYIQNGQNIQKYSFDGAAWNANGTFAVTNPGTGASGTLAGAFLSARVSGSSVELFASFDAGGTDNNYLLKLTDIGAGTSQSTLNISGVDWSVAAGTGYTFRGVDFTPVPEPTAVLAVACIGLAATRRRWSGHTTAAGRNTPAKCRQ